MDSWIFKTVFPIGSYNQQLLEAGPDVQAEISKNFRKKLKEEKFTSVPENGSAQVPNITPKVETDEKFVSHNESKKFKKESHSDNEYASKHRGASIPVQKAEGKNYSFIISPNPKEAFVTEAV